MYVCLNEREREREKAGLEEGAALMCICTHGVMSPVVKWPLPFTQTHAHMHTRNVYTHSVREAGPLRTEPRSHSLQGGREKRRDTGSEGGC